MPLHNQNYKDSLTYYWSMDSLSPQSNEGAAPANGTVTVVDPGGLVSLSGNAIQGSFSTQYTNSPGNESYSTITGLTAPSELSDFPSENGVNNGYLTNGAVTVKAFINSFNESFPTYIDSGTPGVGSFGLVEKMLSNNFVDAGSNGGFSLGIARGTHYPQLMLSNQFSGFAPDVIAIAPAIVTGRWYSFYFNYTWPELVWTLRVYDYTAGAFSHEATGVSDFAIERVVVGGRIGWHSNCLIDEVISGNGSATAMLLPVDHDLIITGNYDNREIEIAGFIDTFDDITITGGGEQPAVPNPNLECIDPDYSKNGTDLINLTALLCDDPNNERFSRLRYLEAINDYILDLALETETTIDQVPVQITADTAEYDILAEIDSQDKRELGYIKNVDFVDDTDDIDFTNNPFAYPSLRPTTQMRRDFQGDLIGTTEGVPVTFNNELLNYGDIELSPTPDTTGETLPTLDNNIRVTYIAYPEIMAVEQADICPEISIPWQFHGCIPFGAAKRLLEEGDAQDFILSRAYARDARLCLRKIIKESQQITKYKITRVG